MRTQNQIGPLAAAACSLDDLSLETLAMSAPLSNLERTLIDEYIRQHGHDPDKLSDVSPDERERLLRDASVYASGRLVEVEARSHFLDEIHDRSD